jgi:DHA2 family lincomycin resistance protein-like MFS transporter
MMQEANVMEHQIPKVKVFPIMFSLMLAVFIGTFNETALNVALSELMRTFHIGETLVQWLTTGYLLTLGILVPLSGLLMKWFTTRQLFLTAVALSIIGAVTGAIAGSFEILMIARIFQAAGTAILLPLLFNSALILFPPEKRGSAMGLVALVFTAAPAVGPTISGLLIVKLSWHWIFWISCLFMLISLVFGAVYIQNISKITKPKIELFSLFMSIFGFGALVFGFSNIGESESDWSSTKVFISIGISIVILTFFVFRQLMIKKPLMDLRAFQKSMFVNGTLLILVCMMVNLSAMLILPMYLIRVLGMNALSAGLVLLPGGLIFAFFAPVIGRLFDIYGPKWLVILGLIIVVVSLWFLTNLSPASTISLIVSLHCSLMIGIVMVWNPAQTNGMNDLPPEMYPDGTAIMNTLLQVAGAIGTATAVSVMKVGETKFLENSSSPDVLHPSLALTAGIQDAFFFTISVSAVGLLIGLFIKRVKVENQHHMK